MSFKPPIWTYHQRSVHGLGIFNLKIPCQKTNAKRSWYNAYKPALLPWTVNVDGRATVHLACLWMAGLCDQFGKKSDLYTMNELDLMYIDLGMVILTADGCSWQTFQSWFLFF